MPYHLPTLNGMRAFEAAARHGSIKAAAAELHVTPGAISQQVKALETEMGGPLFLRGSRGIVLNETGELLYPVLRDSLQRISDTVHGIRNRQLEGTLTVSVLPSFAGKWLVPRLGRFIDRHPEIDVRISASYLLTDFSREDVDLVIRYGRGNYPGLHTTWLLQDELFPVCSPGLLAGPRPLALPGDLSRHTLLHDETHEDWRTWLQAHGAEEVQARRGPIFTDAAMALQAAIRGQGVALARGELVAEDLLEGRLVKPFNLAIPSNNAYYVACPEGVKDWPKIAAFREWVLEEANQERARRNQALPLHPVP